ncbi:MAG: hypothetical protein WCP45_12915, partial [Verrucomicrobiota bacterium]
MSWPAVSSMIFWSLYRHTDIKGWVRRHRSELLSAVATLVNEWVRQGCPDGPSPFTSFPEWGRVVG